ncbi:hypothetical protein CAI21_07705 [Alkalilimnicola ehrlichii]|uniref:Type I secretion protein TolC n=1 Tax=Alkalilimnicola ehrlichii TaxID=351052 RepID=A0A3E0WZJ3_9GAMM|nr:TolC family protein [Alkalilimnicola ehrlichii]RFA30081.1 hypothetical protein CAI21_07705 [Alkalilimnicola ehrlichii]RFA37425.1 hypothetical protein CAL65_09045 [Alkalilimnicola ehrlichii]
MRELTGRDHYALLSLTDHVPLHSPEPANLGYWQQRALEDNLQLSAARYAVQSSMENVGIQRAERYPTLDLTASAGRNDISGGTGLQQSQTSDELRVGIQLTAPLFRGGQLNSQVRQAQYQHTEALERLQALQRELHRATSDAYRGVESSIQRVQALDRARTSTQRALEAVEAGFMAGTRTSVEVLDAQRERFSAERNYRQARYDYLLNTLRLAQTVGALEPGLLSQINQLLETPTES